MKSESYLHHILPLFSILVVVFPVVKVSICLLQVNAALAAGLPDLTVCAAHVDETKDGEGDRNQDQGVVSDGFQVQARFFLDGFMFFVGMKHLENTN